ncbi:transposase [Candidatus Woesebacteria bacterium]|nr:transposase [Candidatus Woesebacteria bacterium]
MVTLTDKQWVVISPLLPKQDQTKGGRPRADDKKTLEGILWILKTGAQWSELPSNYGSYATCWRRLKAWEEDGTWEKIWKQLLSTLSRADKLMLSVGMVDGTFAPAKKGGTLLVRRRKAKAPK